VAPVKNAWAKENPDNQNVEGLPLFNQLRKNASLSKKSFIKPESDFRLG
jgi:hypothetical protein